MQTRMDFVDTIVVITSEEFQDPTWKETTVVSTDQQTVHAMRESNHASTICHCLMITHCGLEVANG